MTKKLSLIETGSGRLTRLCEQKGIRRLTRLCAGGRKADDSRDCVRSEGKQTIQAIDRSWRVVDAQVIICGKK